MGVAASGIFILCLCFPAYCRYFPQEPCRMIFRLQVFKPGQGGEQISAWAGCQARVGCHWRGTHHLRLLSVPQPVLLFWGTQTASAQRGLVSLSAFPSSMNSLCGDGSSEELRVDTAGPYFYPVHPQWSPRSLLLLSPSRVLS